MTRYSSSATVLLDPAPAVQQKQWGPVIIGRFCDKARSSESMLIGWPDASLSGSFIA